MAATRIYHVFPKAIPPNAETPVSRLVRAPTQAQALGHVARATLAVTKPTQDELIRLGGAGVRVEEAVKDEA